MANHDHHHHHHSIITVARRTLHVQREHGKPVIVELVRKAPVAAGVFAEPVEDEHRSAVVRRSTWQKKEAIKKKNNIILNLLIKNK